MSQDFDDNVLDLVKQQGFYLYEYMSDLERSEEQLSRKEKFYNLLTGKKNIDKKYDHVLKVWNNFEIKMAKDYYDLYLKCDVSSLADVLKKCRNNSLKNYGLCPSHYLSTPALSWDETLNITKVKPELITDPDM